MKIFIVLWILFFNCFNLYAQKFYKTSGTPEFEELKKNGFIYIKTGNAPKDSLVENALRSTWKATKYKIIEHSWNPNPTKDSVIDETKETIKLSGNEIILTELKVTLNDRFGIRSDHILCLIPSKYLKNINPYPNFNPHINPQSSYTHKDCIGYIGLNAFNGKSDLASISFYYEYGLTALNDCIEIIIEKAIDIRIWSSYNLVYDEITLNSGRLKDKTLLMIDDGINYVKLNDLNKAGIKYKHVTQKEFEEIIKTDPSNYCLLFFGGNTNVYNGIIDLSSRSLIYAANFSSGFFGSRDIKRIKKLSGITFTKTETPPSNYIKPIVTPKLDSALLNKHLVLMSNIISSRETVFHSNGRIEEKQKGSMIHRYIYFEGTDIYLSRKTASEYFKQYPEAFKYFKRSITFTRIGNWAILPMFASTVGFMVTADKSYSDAQVNPKIFLGIGFGISIITNRVFGFASKFPLKKAVSKYNNYIDKKNGL